MSIIYDERQQIAQRVARLKSGQAHCQDPPSRTARTVANIEVRAQVHQQGGWEGRWGLMSEEPQICTESSFIVVEVRTEVVLWAGRSVHCISGQEGGLRLRRKKVRLVNSDSVLPVLGFLI